MLSGVCLFVIDLALVVRRLYGCPLAALQRRRRALAALGIEQYMLMALGIAVTTNVLFAFRGMYAEPRPYAWPTRLYNIVTAVSTALVVALTLSYFHGDSAFSRLWSATGWAVAIGALIAWRELATHGYTALRERIAPARRALVVGANPLGKQLASELAEWCHVVGYVDNGTDLVDPSLRLLGPVAELEHIVHDYAIDELIIALPTRRREQVTRLVDRGFRRSVKIKFVTGIGELLPERLEVERRGGRSYIAFQPVAKVSWVKRALDVLLVGGGLLAISPILFAIALAIKLDSSGPIFYRQTRVGKNGRHFSMLKFRSMCVGADKKLAELRHQNEASGPLFKMQGRSAHHARRSRPAPLQPGRAAAVVQRPARRNEPGWSPPAAARGGRRIRGLAARSVARRAWFDRPVAGQRAQRGAVPRHGATGPALHPQLVARARRRDPAAHRPGGAHQPRRVLSPLEPRGIRPPQPESPPRFHASSDCAR